MTRKFLIGSRAIFSGYKDFESISTDYDWLIIEDEPSKDYILYDEDDEMVGKNHYIRWKNIPKEELLHFHKGCYTGTFIQKFLCPEYAEYLNLTIEELMSIGHMVNYLDDDHTYEKIVYDSYVENHGFFLTEEQKEKAYEEYKNARQKRDEYHEKMG